MARWTKEQYEAFTRLSHDVKAAPKSKKRGGKTKAAMIKEGVAKGEFLVSTLKRKGEYEQ